MKKESVPLNTLILREFNCEFQLIGLTLSSLIAVGSCWTSYSPKFQFTHYASERSDESYQCRILDSAPFFRATPRDVDGLNEQLIFLTEFSRFMNSKSLSLLWVNCIPTIPCCNMDEIDEIMNKALFLRTFFFVIRNLPSRRKPSTGAKRYPSPCRERYRSNLMSVAYPVVIRGHRKMNVNLMLWLPWRERTDK